MHRQANPNIPNQREITPIITILKSKDLNITNKEQILTFLLENAKDIDLDNFRNGEARKLLTQNFPQLELPSISEKQEWDFAKLIRALRNEREVVFLRGLSDIYQEQQKNDVDVLEKLFCEHEADETLLIVAAKRDFVISVERMIRLGANVNCRIRRNLSPIDVACRFGHHKVLELLLKSPKIDLSTAESILSTVVKKVGEEQTNHCDFNKCLELLINHSGIDIDRTDLFKNAPLHYAVRSGNQSLILKLLKNGAYIGTKNKFDRLPISDINPKVLEAHFDSCIKTNGLRCGEENFEIIFDYTNFVPDCYKREQSRAASGLKKDPVEYRNEMAPIEHIAEANDLKHLLSHPLITSFLFLKWQRLAIVFYINFFLYSIFCVNMLLYILFCYRQETTSRSLEMFVYSVSIIFAFGLLFREALQFVMSPPNYLKTSANYMEIVLIVSIFLILFKFNEHDESFRRTLAAFAILLTIAEFFLLTGSLPILSFSTHLVMLKTVSKSFIKSLLLYSIILLAFSLCFYTLLNEGRKPGAPEQEDGDFNKFNHPGLAIIKTLVMLTGEFEAANINFDSNPASYLIFLMFVFLISSVLFNLLNGLAVSDTQVKFNN